jgi:hypothetical protein
MNGGAQMQLILENDSAIQSLVDSYTQDAATVYLILNQTLLPDKVSSDSGDIDLTVTHKTINHFQVTNLSGAIQVSDIIRQISCRSDKEQEAVDMQTACFDALNRVISTDKKVYFVAETMPVIRPQDSVDNFNAPLNVRTIIR